jgi:hypothetical protein
MARLVLLAIDLVAVSLLVFGLYFPRHRRLLAPVQDQVAWRPGRAGGAAR